MVTPFFKPAIEASNLGFSRHPAKGGDHRMDGLPAAQSDEMFNLTGIGKGGCS